MKTGLLLVFLLGFGYIAPKGCAKKQAEKDQQQKVYPTRPCKQMALFGPIRTIKVEQRTAQRGA